VELRITVSKLLPKPKKLAVYCLLRIENGTKANTAPKENWKKYVILRTKPGILYRFLKILSSRPLTEV
jgi:hypothetical protein